MGLSDEEKTLLEQLTKKSQESEGDDDFEVEWWEEDDKGNRRGGRVPWKTGKSIYGKHFPDLFGEKPAPGKESGTGKEGEGEGGTDPTSKKYFGR